MQGTHEDSPPSPGPTAIVDDAINAAQAKKDDDVDRLCDMDESEFRERCVSTLNALEQNVQKLSEKQGHLVSKYLALEEKYDRLDARMERQAVLIDKLQDSNGESSKHQLMMGPIGIPQVPELIGGTPAPGTGPGRTVL